MESLTARSDSEGRPLDDEVAGPAASGPHSTLRNVLRQFAEAVGALLGLGILVVFTIQVFFRYFLNDPVPWTDEAATLMFPWLVFWGVCFLVPVSGNVRFDIIYNSTSPSVRRVFLLITSLTVAVVFAWAFPKTWDYIDYMWRHRTPMLGIRYFWVFLCYAMFMVVMIARCLWISWLVASGNERAELV